METIMSQLILRRRLSTRALLYTAASVAASVLTALPTLAQGTDSTGSYALPEPDLRLRPGATVHIAAPSVGQLEATLVHADGRDLVLRAEGNERTVRLEAGDSLWVLGHATARGAKTGATVGLVLTGALVVLFVSTCRAGSDDPCTGAAGFIPAGIVFTGTGALIGAALGRVMPHWERRWP
jgi:hypothetical protein